MLNIVIINYKQSENISDIVDRLRQEDLSRVRIAIVDDSVDCTEYDHLKMIARALDHLCDEVRVVSTGDACGAGEARNVGANELPHSDEDWLWFIDGDDMIMPGAVKRICDFANREIADAFTIPYLSETDGSAPNLVEIKPSDHLRPWEVGVMAWNKVIRYSIFQRFRRNVMLEDTDWWWSIAISMNMIGHLTGEPCYRYRRLSSGSETSRISKLMDNSELAKPKSIMSFITKADRKMTRTIADQFELCAELVRMRSDVRDAQPDALAAFDFVLKRNLEAISMRSDVRDAQPDALAALWFAIAGISWILM